MDFGGRPPSPQIEETDVGANADDEEEGGGEEEDSSDEFQYFLQVQKNCNRIRQFDTRFVQSLKEQRYSEELEGIPPCKRARLEPIRTDSSVTTQDADTDITMVYDDSAS